MIDRLRRWWQTLNREREIRATPLDGRLVIFDLETTGLNIRRDRPLSVGAVAVEGRELSLDDSFVAEISPVRAPAAENVLVHRLTPDRLASGQASAEVLQRFLDYVGDSPLMAYHADFDQAVLTRALRRELGLRRTPPCLDIASWVLLAAPELGPRPPRLDQALAYFRMRRDNRHDALADALAAARLVMVLLTRLTPGGIRDFGELSRVLRARRAMHLADH